MAPSRKVKSLYEIADKLDSSKRPDATIDAKSLFSLVKHEAAAFQDPNSKQVKKLLDCFHRCRELAAKDPGSSRMKDLLWEWLTRVDECFFFKTLTREIKTKHTRKNGIVTLKIKKDADPDNRRGCFAAMARVITIWLKGLDTQGNFFPIESVLHSIMHESTHAFLWFFEDMDHPKHEERVRADAFHGPLFCEFVRVITNRVSDLTKSRQWKEACYIGYQGPEEKRPEWVGHGPAPCPTGPGGHGHGFPVFPPGGNGFPGFPPMGPGGPGFLGGMGGPGFAGGPGYPGGFPFPQ
ncbi:hypothetical protein F5Y09DRAFT_354617 [Xylaria sp. FL1042]|nr:hypothetical protein F5Y09DRAFT_354617 [Xylaria sp. FL1042]